MRRAVRAIVLTLVLAIGGGERVHAITAATELATIESKLAGDIGIADGYTCGGLVNSTDARMLHYYRRRELLDCTLITTAQQIKKDGKCMGHMCRMMREYPGDERTLSYQCDGTTECDSCLPLPNPRKSCYMDEANSRYREWECTILPRYPLPPDVANPPLMKAKCYSFLPNTRSDQSYFPSTFNCVATYPSPPARGDEPKSEKTLIPPIVEHHDLRPAADPWEATPESNVSIKRKDDNRYPPDSTMPSHLDTARTQSVERVIQSTIQSSVLWPTQAGQITQTIGRILQPPEIRLVVSRGGLALAHSGSNLFSRIFPFLSGGKNEESKVLRALGNEDGVLEIASEYLKSIPLLEVEYVPVTVAVPTVSEDVLYSVIAEWETWLTDVQARVSAEPGFTLDPTIPPLVQDNIEILRSYIALQRTLREYRLEFPRYIDALLSYVEAANDFYQQWLDTNKRRLLDWHAAFTGYLPLLRSDLITLANLTQKFVNSCLAGSCRMDVIPVKTGTGALPWNILPDQIDAVFDPNDPALKNVQAWLADGYPVWQNYGGQVTSWHSFDSYARPLPDVTIDLSEIRRSRTIAVPVFVIEKHPIAIPFPPFSAASFSQGDLADLPGVIQPLPRLSPPLFTIAFPQLTLPDPKTSLFAVPEAPPRALSLWSTVLTWRKNQMNRYIAACDPSPAAKTFLLNEFSLYEARGYHDTRDPASVRAAAYIQGQKTFYYFFFGVPSLSIEAIENPKYWWWYSYYYYYDTITRYMNDWYWRSAERFPPLQGAEQCTTCESNRPQRYIQQHFELSDSWEILQQRMLTAIDEWNAQVRFTSVISRNESTSQEESVWEDLRPFPPEN